MADLQIPRSSGTATNTRLGPPIMASFDKIRMPIEICPHYSRTRQPLCPVIILTNLSNTDYRLPRDCPILHRSGSGSRSMPRRMSEARTFIFPGVELGPWPRALHLLGVSPLFCLIDIHIEGCVDDALMHPGPHSTVSTGPSTFANRYDQARYLQTGLPPHHQHLLAVE